MSRGWQTFIALTAVLFVETVAASVFTLVKAKDADTRLTRLERRPCHHACRTAIIREILRHLQAAAHEPHAQPPNVSGGDASTGSSPPSQPGPPSGGPSGNGDGPPATTPTPNPAPPESEPPLIDLNADCQVNALGVRICVPLP